MKDDNRSLTEEFSKSAQRTLTLDIEKYQSWLDGSGLNDDQKEEFLQAVWSIVVTFVELGFGVHPLQEVCGKESHGIVPSPKDAFDQVDLGKLDKSSMHKDSSP